jgi:hypothetical protein
MEDGCSKRFDIGMLNAPAESYSDLGRGSKTNDVAAMQHPMALNSVSALNMGRGLGIDGSSITPHTDR